jgi:hypothetical protein
MDTKTKVMKCLMAGACCAGLMAQSTGVLAGRVTGDGAAIAGAMVQAVLQTTPVPEGGPRIWRTRSDAGGAFRFDAVEAGSYRICVTDAGDWLDPCQWTPAHVVAVPTGPASVELRLQRGTRVAVVAFDHAGLTTGRASEVTPPLRVSTTDGAGRTRTMPLTRTEPGSFLYSALLPADIEVDFKIVSRLFLIADENGRHVDAQDHRVPVRTRRAQRPATVYPGSIFRFVPQFDVVIPVRIVGVAAGR